MTCCCDLSKKNHKSKALFIPWYDIVLPYVFFFFFAQRPKLSLYQNWYDIIPSYYVFGVVCQVPFIPRGYIIPRYDIFHTYVFFFFCSDPSSVYLFMGPGHSQNFGNGLRVESVLIVSRMVSHCTGSCSRTYVEYTVGMSVC